MLQRVITSFVALAIFFAVVLLGEVAFCVAVGVVTVWMLLEMYKAIDAGKPLTILGMVSAVLIGLFACLGFAIQGTTVLAIMLSIMMFLIATVYLHGKIEFKKVYSVAFLTWYIVLSMFCIIKLYFQPTVAEFMRSGIFGVLPIFVCAWMTDVGAYFSGYFFGKHKLIERVSPKKTVEGAIGGVIVAVLSCWLYLFIVDKFFGAYVMDYGMMAIMAAIASVLAQFGDLAASVIKREVGIKDFGTIFPGHGGFLDRFDSVIFIAPFVYYFMTYVPVLWAFGNWF